MISVSPNGESLLCSGSKAPQKIFSPNGELLLFAEKEVAKKSRAKPIARSEGRMLIGSTSVGLLGESWEFTGEFHQVIPPHSAAGFAGLAQKQMQKILLACAKEDVGRCRIRWVCASGDVPWDFNCAT